MHSIKLTPFLYLFQVIKDVYLFTVVGVLIFIDVIILLSWNFWDPLQRKTRYLTTYVSLFYVCF